MSRQLSAQRKTFTKHGQTLAGLHTIAFWPELSDQSRIYTSQCRSVQKLSRVLFHALYSGY